jgi:toxin-antitoxin system PIN domain toxin
MAFLLDVNVLIARSDPRHFHYRAVCEWFTDNHDAIQMTCPIVENGFVRIFGNASYKGGPGTIAKAKAYLDAIHLLPQHRFVPDDISLTSTKLFNSFETVRANHLTDVYLLALASKLGVKFVTLDGKIQTEAVKNGADSLETIRL